MTRFRLDPGARRLDGGRVLLAGSPLRLFRLTAGGATVVDAIEGDEQVFLTGSTGRLLDRLLDAGAVHPRPPGSSSATRDDVTVVIPTFGADVGAVVEALRGTVAEIVVVDDGSFSPIALPAAARLVRRAVNGGPGAAREHRSRRGHHAARRLRRRRHDPDAQLARTAPRPLRRRPGRARGPEGDGPRPGPRRHRLRPLRHRSLPPRPRPHGGPCPGSHPGLLRAGCRHRRTDRGHPSSRRLRRGSAGRRRRRPRVAARRGRLAVPLRAGGDRDARGAPPAPGLGRPARGLWPLRRAPGRAPSGRAGPSSREPRGAQGRGRSPSRATRSPGLGSRSARSPCWSASCGPSSGRGRLPSGWPGSARWPPGGSSPRRPHEPGGRRPPASPSSAGAPGRASPSPRSGPALLTWAARRPPLDPVRFTALYALDDAAYGVGVWRGRAGRPHGIAPCCPISRPGHRRLATSADPPAAPVAAPPTLGPRHGRHPLRRPRCLVRAPRRGVERLPRCRPGREGQRLRVRARTPGPSRRRPRGRRGGGRARSTKSPACRPDRRSSSSHRRWPTSSIRCPMPS